MPKELLFSVTAADCEWEFFTAGGKGGQHQNKTSSACRCTHKASGAVGISRDERSQHTNKKIAFRRMAETQKFKLWVKLEAAKKSKLAAYEAAEKLRLETLVDKMIKPENLKFEVKKDGEWIEVKEEELLAEE